MKRECLKYLIAFVFSAVVLILSLTAVVLIPRSAIQSNMDASAEYFTQHGGNFYYVIDKAECSRIDQYADSILLNIAYFFDPDHPIESIMWANYYDGPGTKPESFFDALTDGIAANTQYLRYWHGSIVLVRPMLMLWSIKGIYIFHSIVMTILVVWLVILLLKRGKQLEAIALVLALVTVNIWFVPICLEYTWMFTVMLAASIVAVLLDGRNIGRLFLITGIVAAFLDFLTTETITLVIPLLISLRLNPGDKAARWKRVAQSCILWAIGFVGMWVLKWAGRHHLLFERRKSGVNSP